MAQGRKIRVALVGCGDIAEQGHVPSLMRHPRFELAAVCDVRRERGELLARQAGGVPWTADHREFFARKDLDAVVLALHPEVGIVVAEDFLRHGKPVLGEKPLAVNLEAGLRLKRVIQETGGLYQIGFVFRYSPLVLRVAEYAEQLGRPARYRVGIHDERVERSNAAHFERIQQILRNSSAITHEGSHVLDFFRLWNPAPFVRAQATAVATEPDFNGPNLWNALLGCADGSVLALEISWFVPDLPSSSILVTGPLGHLCLDLRTGVGWCERGGRREELALEPLVQNWVGQLDAFAEAIDRGAPVSATVDDGLRALAASQACEVSWRTSQAVAIQRME